MTEVRSQAPVGFRCQHSLRILETPEYEYEDDDEDDTEYRS